ncbi:hypothetical protein AB5I41_22030 [Sphingomonas sp. MMS24-JH45]
MRALLILSTFALAGCGSTTGLKPPAGAKAVPVAYGADTPATTGQLLTPNVQQRPQRGDTTLTRSQERATDDFDLPPN